MQDGDGVRVSPDRLTEIARAGTAMSDVVRGTDLAGAVRAVGAALPGSGTAGSAGAVASRWGESVTGLADGLGRYASALTSTAQNYRDTDDHVAGTLGNIAAGTPAASAPASGGEPGGAPGPATSAIGEALG